LNEPNANSISFAAVAFNPLSNPPDANNSQSDCHHNFHDSITIHFIQELLHTHVLKLACSRRTDKREKPNGDRQNSATGIKLALQKITD